MIYKDGQYGKRRLVKAFPWTSSNYLLLFVLVACPIIECTLGAGDINDSSSTESSVIQQSSFKEIRVYTYKDMDSQFDIGKVHMGDDIAVGYGALKWFIWRNGSPSHPTFSLNNTSGMISMRKETKPGTYRLNFNVTEGEHRDAAATVLVTVKNVAFEAIKNHGFIRFAHISGEDFIQIWDSQKTINVQSYADKLQLKISQIFNTTREHVDIFSVMTNQTNDNPYSDVRFTVLRTPGYYHSAILNGLVLLHREEIERDLGINMTIVDIDECLNNARFYCQDSCTSVVKTINFPATLDANKLSLVGPHFVTSFDCEFGRDRNCKAHECFNSGMCVEGRNGPTAAHWTHGPRRQSRTFMNNDSAWYPPLDMCEVGQLSLEFITKKERGLLLYNGPLTNPKAGDAAGTFFVSLELVQGEPRLLLDGESGTKELRVRTNGSLADGKWHRIDIEWMNGWNQTMGSTWGSVKLIVDLCKFARQDNGSLLNTTNCLQNTGAIQGFKLLHSKTPLQVGGIHADVLNASYFKWTRTPTRESFDGCIRNLIVKDHVYDLGNPHFSRHKVTPGCRQVEEKCRQNKTLSRCLKHGTCVGSFAGEPRCECEPGWTGHDCTRQTVPASFNSGSYVKYALSHQPDPFEMHLQLRFRTWEKEARIFYMSNHDNTQVASIQIRHGRISFECNFNTSVLQFESYNLWLPNGVQVNDGQWHNVKVSRLGGTAVMEVDSGEGWIYRQIRRNFEEQQFMMVDGYEGMYAGGFRDSFENGSIIAFSAYQNGCLDDIRLNGINLPLAPASTSGDTQQVQAVMIGELEEGCLSNDPCRNVSCPKPFQCFDIWRKQECGCADGTEKSTDGNNARCIDKNECLENPCFNGGTCINLEPPQRFRCDCLSEFWGTTCELSHKGPSPPHIVKQPPTEELLFQVKQCADENDKPFTIECEAKGDPTPIYKWTKNGKHFNWKADGDRITQREGHGTLTFNSPKSEDDGQYQCFATNKWGTASTNSVFMRRAVLKSFKDKEPATVTAELGRPFKLICSPPEGWPKPQVSWVLQNSEGVLKSINSPRITAGPDGTLWFSNITRSDIISGYLYACAVYSEATYETKLGNKRFLTISQSSGEPSMKIHKPEIQYITKQKTVAIKGSTVRLWCIVGGTPLPEIKWTKVGGPGQSEDGGIEYENYNKTMKITNVDFDNQGIYECGWSFITSSGAKQNYSHSMQVDVYAVPFFTVEPELQYPFKGDTVEIKCDANGNPPPNLTWTHNGKILRVQNAEPNSRRNVSRNVIMIENVTKADTSNYGCNASNEYGYVYKDVFINVVLPDDDEDDSKAPDHSTDIIIISLSVVLAVVIALVIFGLFFMRRYYRKSSVGGNEIHTFLNGDPLADAKDNAYKMPYDKDRYEIGKNSFSIDQDGVLGSGEFGRVCKGKITINSTETAVAIKTANPQKASKTILTGLLSEIKVLAYVGKHVNITELLGANTSEVKVGKVYIFLELCPMGSLEKHLRKLRPETVSNNDELVKQNADGKTDVSYANTIEMSSLNVRPLDPSVSEDLYRWAKEICNGMSFLATKHVVHADLATRNVLLSENKEAKICDFGLSRRMYNYASYVKSQQEPLPWKWMAPESLRIQEFNEKTDVWAFGVTLWEMYSLGDSPYQGMSWDLNFANMLERGFRLGEPQFNEKDMYSVMKQCWTINQNWRPKFADLNGQFANTEG